MTLGFAVVGKQIPLEIMPLGDFEPIYGSPLNVQAGELPVLPMSIYGSVAMAHAPDADEGFAAADEFFIYKYDRASSGLAGLSFDEGTFGVFAYIAKVSCVACTRQPLICCVHQLQVSGLQVLLSRIQWGLRCHKWKLVVEITVTERCQTC